MREKILTTASATPQPHTYSMQLKSQVTSFMTHSQDFHKP